MKYAVFADIHGNADALRAVLADLEAQGLTEAVNLGDVFSGPLDTAQTAALIMARDFPTVRGNHDRYLLEQDPEAMGPSDRVAFDQLDQAGLDWLAALPETLALPGGVFACHGTPRDDGTYWLERVTPDGVVRAATLDEVETEAAGIDAGLILCAHTHLPRVVRLRDGRMIVNPGSVGCPAYTDEAPVPHVVQTGTPTASYAIVEGSGRDWTVTFRALPYDSDTASALAARRGRTDWAEALATGWITA